MKLILAFLKGGGTAMLGVLFLVALAAIIFGPPVALVVFGIWFSQTIGVEVSIVVTILSCLFYWGGIAGLHYHFWPKSWE